MECKSHVVCANALALAFIRPDSINSLLITLGAATIGSTICDIDASDKDNKGYIVSYSIFTIISLITIVFLEYFFHIGINNWILENSSYYKILICFFLLIGVCYYGYLMPHRSFLHSFLGIGIMILLCYISLGNVVIPFMIGIVSHIVLDLFNKKGLWLFYPLKKKYSLKLCVYNGEVNYIIFNVFTTILIVELVLIDYFVMR